MAQNEDKNITNFAYFTKPEYFSILKDYNIPELKKFIQKNKSIKINNIQTNQPFHPTSSQDKVLNFVEEYLKSKKSAPLKLLITGLAGKFY